MKLAAALVGAALAACGAASTTPPAGPPSLAAGERAYQKCFSCHALEPGRNDLSGPTLHAVVGRPIAAERGFDYSPALKRFAAVNPAWTRPLLDRFVADAEGLVPGTAMNFHGISDSAERRALIDYLDRAGR